MVVDERPREDFGKMILKVATGLVLPKLVDTFLNIVSDVPHRSTVIVAKRIHIFYSSYKYNYYFINFLY